MKKVFCTWVVGAMLVAVSCSAAGAYPSGASEEGKQKVRIVVVEKKERQGDNGKGQKPNTGSRSKQP